MKVCVCTAVPGGDKVSEVPTKWGSFLSHDFRDSDCLESRIHIAVSVQTLYDVA